MVALKTFNNLPQERQQEIIGVCLEEFAFNDYQSASLSTIIKKLNLAKGSFYRYFESKQSLYFYLLDYAVQQRLANDKGFIKQPPEDFFDLIILHFRAKVHFDKTQGVVSAFLYNVLREKNTEELGNIQAIRKQKALDIMYQLVDQYVENGQLRNDIDRKILAWHVLQTQLSIFEFMELHYQQDFRQNIQNNKQLYNLPEEELVAIARQFVEIQKNGFKNK
ncbi:TetR/AcrR family transcriptional regulator [Imperialibacter roseus]|uniref:TetR/AcrR family transcriptional regulator n=1 Tax=Imperialibacter roseus TaxID=1324217 RepID=A0ABZ0IHI3_9BACT|nr:TetR/AcrR family transcriptional regulator [Imperialibacter roseus]WOK04468.1 TetR/AcrR family transcriptional regulator [Imperialibacter roseus]